MFEGNMVWERVYGDVIVMVEVKMNVIVGFVKYF